MQVRLRGNNFQFCFLHQTLSFYFNINTALVLDIVRSNTKLTININNQTLNLFKPLRKSQNFEPVWPEMNPNLSRRRKPGKSRILPNPGSSSENWTMNPTNFKSQSLEGSEIMNRIRSNTIFEWWKNVFAKNGTYLLHQENNFIKW